MTASGDAILIRALGPDDWRAAAALHGETMAQAWPPGSWLATLEAPPAFGFAAELEGRMIGLVLARAVADEAEILMLTVAADMRRQGIATQLLRSALAEAEGRGAAKTFLEVAAGNLAAIALYRGLGFVDAARRTGYYTAGDVGDALLLTRVSG